MCKNKLRQVSYEYTAAHKILEYTFMIEIIDNTRNSHFKAS